MGDQLIIVGDGGHAKVIIDIIRHSTDYVIIGVTSGKTDNKNIMNIPVIGSDEQLTDIFDNGVENVFIAIGDNKKRSDLAIYSRKIGFNLINAISKHTYISPNVELGKGIAIMPGVVINPDSMIGDNSIINTGSTIDHDCRISCNVHIGPGCNLAGKVTIGEGAFLGIGCKCIPGITIGPWSIIGAGSVIVNDVPPFSKVYGVPGKVRNLIEGE